MLVLSRKESQHIKLGESIVITVVQVGRDKVRLGIQAPESVRVLRGELEPYEESFAAQEVIPQDVVTQDVVVREFSETSGQELLCKP